ncbi:MAG: hypothetical protein JNL98_23375 [Bryobacterales bacterium]|nr:hypothetical protein [Bryobacterales bacterium]
MFTVRTIFPEQQRVETGSYELEPSNDQGKAVCALFLDFLSEQPTEFRATLPFLKKGDTELEWTAAEGGAALMTFYEAGEPLSMGILLSGVKRESDEQMMEALRQAVLEPVFGEEAGKYLEAPERPLLLNVIFPGNPELIPRTQLLATALASVFFRVMLEMHERMQQQPPPGSGPN